MKAAVIGALLGVVVTVVAVGVLPVGTPARAEIGAAWHPGSSSDLITSSTPVAENRQLVTVIDPKTRVLAVYLIDGATGVVSLKSVRAFQWDLQLAEFNGTTPLPREIRSLVEQHSGQHR
jgi:hypothetical protein